MTLASDGQIPTLIVQGTRQSAFMQFAAFGDTHEERVQQMLAAGGTLAEKRLVGMPEQVFFIAEGWMSTLAEGQELRTPPSQDQNRKEVLIIASLDVREHTSRGIILEMIRDHTARLTELRPFRAGEGAEEAGQMDSALLTAFMDGFIMGLSDRRD